MTPEEKAKGLVKEFQKFADPTETTWAKECAIIAVKEILDLDVWEWPHNAEYGKLYWESVLECLNKM